MAADNVASITLRDASESDVPALAAIRSSRAFHRGRLRDAQRSGFRYFVILQSETVIGFVSLVFRRPLSWSNSDDGQHLPEIVDLYVAEKQREQGYGSQVIRALEHITTAESYQHIHIAVDPVDNPRAYNLYQHLGYQQIQPEPYFHSWQAVDGDGKIERGSSWLVNMMKVLQEN